MPPRLAAARAGSVTAKAIIQSAIVMLLVHIFRPVRRQPSPSGTARVWIMVASEPAPGSDSPKHMDCRPETRPARIRVARLGRHLLEHRARPERPVAEREGPQPAMRPAQAIDHLPADVVREVALAEPAQRRRHAQVEVARLRGGHAHLPDQLDDLRRVAAVGAVSPPRVVQELRVLVVARDHLRVQEALEPRVICWISAGMSKAMAVMARILADGIGHRKRDPRRRPVTGARGQ